MEELPSCGMPWKLLFWVVAPLCGALGLFAGYLLRPPSPPELEERLTVAQEQLSGARDRALAAQREASQLSEDIDGLRTALADLQAERDSLREQLATRRTSPIAEGQTAEAAGPFAGEPTETTESPRTQEMATQVAEQGSGGAVQPVAKSERPRVSAEPPVRRGGTVAFANGTKRQFRSLDGVRLKITNATSVYYGDQYQFETVLGEIVLPKVEEGEIVGETRIPVERVATMTVNPKGAEHVELVVVSTDGTADTFVVSGMIVEIDWADTVDIEMVVIANDDIAKDYLGMEVTFSPGEP